jgi:hypothetical protein
MPGALLPVSLSDVRLMAERMASSASDAVALSSDFGALVSRLGPERGELLSRYRFERASLWSLGVSFENVPPDAVPPQKVIRCNRDMWVRGVVAQAYTHLAIAPSDDAVDPELEMWQALGSSRNLFDALWRLNSIQGFINAGGQENAPIEALEPAATITGDGFFFVPLDWRLEREQTIEVTVRSRMLSVLPAGMVFATDVELPDILRTLRWIVVSFWCEEIDAPSLR